MAVLEKSEEKKMVKKIFEIKENRLSVVNIVLAILSLISIFTSCLIIKVIWGFGVAVKKPIDVVVVAFDIIITIGSPICIIIRNLKLKNISKFIRHTLLEYAIGFGVMLALLISFVLIW